MKLKNIIMALLLAALTLGAATAQAEDHDMHCASCASPRVCQVGGEAYDGEDVRHGSRQWASNAEGHWEACADCGEALSGVEAHAQQCTWPGVCITCKAPYSGGNITHPLEQADELVHDSEKHWWKCVHCGQPSASPDAHCTNPGDPEGVCSRCGAVYGSQAAPTDAPAENPTVAPTRKPAAKKSAPTATPAAGAEPDGLAGWFQTSDAAAAGWTLTAYPAGSRADGVTICLTGGYDEAEAQGFRAWQESVTDVEALRRTESFGDFVALARALMEAMLPEGSAGAADRLIVALLRSGFDGTLESGALPPAALDEDVAGEVVGYLATEAGEVFLVLREGGVALLARGL